MATLLLALGLAGFAAGAAVLIWAGAKRPARGRAPGARGYPAYGWWALAAMAALEILLAARVAAVTTFFTALIWTAFIPAVDAAVRRQRGRSLLSEPARFATLCVLSVPIWLIFEAYNLRLQNWRYTGVPDQFWWFLIGGGWAFATILPGLFEVADLLLAAGLERAHAGQWRCGPVALGAIAVLGFLCLLVPLVVPRTVASYLFGLAWGGFFLLLEPLNRGLGLPSLLAEWEGGRPGRIWALLASGAICGFCWEFWNFWAAARWEYIFPIWQHFKAFAMPLPGFLGFPPFALECFALTVLVSWLALPEPLRPGLPRAEQARD